MPETIQYPPVHLYAFMELRERGEHQQGTQEEFDAKFKAELDAIAKDPPPYESHYPCQGKGCREDGMWREVWPWIKSHTCTYHKRQHGSGDIDYKGRFTEEGKPPLDIYC